MNIQPVNQNPQFRANCIVCNIQCIPVWADLDGEPFKAYYCNPCAIRAGRLPEEE